MLQSRMMMGMPITVEIIDEGSTQTAIDETFDYFNRTDEKFSPFKNTSEVSQINAGKIKLENYSVEMNEIINLSEKTKRETNGYFDIITPDNKLNPSGLVKGWAVNNVAQRLKNKGWRNFYIDAGGDIQAEGLNSNGKPWRVGIRNPFTDDPDKVIIKILSISGRGVATSGTYVRGNHIYNPNHPAEKISDIVSFTIVAPNVYEADRMATAAFAMGRSGIDFIESLPDFEGYMVDKNGIATMTGGFSVFVI